MKKYLEWVTIIALLIIIAFVIYIAFLAYRQDKNIQIISDKLQGIEFVESHEESKQD